MYDTLKDLNLFDSYFEGRMTIEEEEKFEKRLDNDTPLQLAFEEYKIMRLGVYVAEEKRKEKEDEKFRKIEEAVVIPLKSHFNIKPFLFLVAALACLFVGANSYQSYLATHLMKKHAYPMPTTMDKTTQNDFDTAFEKGVYLREQQKYDEALKMFENVLENDKLNIDKAELEIALIQIKQGAIEKGKESLDNVLRVSTNDDLKKEVQVILTKLTSFWFSF
ncbi:MAG: tetratricopeptide repeat protein [Chitinophagales bacterium]